MNHEKVSCQRPVRKIAALRIEDVNVVESAGPVLEVRKVDIFACRIAKVGLQYGGLLHAAVGDDGIVDFLERCKHALLVCQAGLVVCGYRCLVFAFFASEVEYRSGDRAYGVGERRLEQTGQLVVFKSSCHGNPQPWETVGICQPDIGHGGCQALLAGTEVGPALQ